MFSGKRVDPITDFIGKVIQVASESIYKTISSSQANELAREFVNGNRGLCDSHLEEFVLIPLAYEMVRNWRGCGAGTCDTFSRHLEAWNWAFLVPIKVFLRRPPELTQAHFRMWEQILRPEGINAMGIQIEFNDAEKYLQHMLLHGTTDAVYRLSGMNRPFAGSPPRLPAEIRTLLRDILERARQHPNKDDFVTREVDSLARCVTPLI